ncbi:hypothetical protein PMI38_02740, partial [Pseudomonas sp. GM84]
MYFLERGFQWSKTLITYEEACEEYKNEKRQPGQTELHAPEGVGDSVSKVIYDNNSLYSYSEQYIDLRTPNDEKRGIVTFFAGCIYGMIIYAFILTMSVSIPKFTSGLRHNGEFLTGSDYFFLTLFPIFWLVLLGVFLKYTFRFFRLES